MASNGCRSGGQPTPWTYNQLNIINTKGGGGGGQIQVHPNISIHDKYKQRITMVIKGAKLKVQNGNLKLECKSKF